MLPHREFRIYMPNVTDTNQVAALKDDKPFLMKANIPVGSPFYGVVAIPSLIDMMGFSGGGGPPGYAFAVDPEQEKEDPCLFAAVMPNRALPKLPGKISYVPLGVVQAVGILFGHFMLAGEAVRDGTAEQELLKEGGLILEMIQYEPPAMLRSLYDPKVQAALSGQLEDALKHAKAKAAQPK